MTMEHMRWFICSASSTADYSDATASAAAAELLLYAVGFSDLAISSEAECCCFF